MVKKAISYIKGWLGEMIMFFFLGNAMNVKI